jgi:hypothetical protein
MKRIISSALVLGLLSFPAIGLVGCGEESKVENKEVVKTPDGKTTTTKSETVKSEGSNPPANSSGETAKTPK